MIINEDSALWQYLSPWQRTLVGDGEFLLKDSIVHANEEPTDYSYIVFPFAKMYEGFLKQLFLDLDIISERDYFSTHFRIGKALSPNLAPQLGKRSVYYQISKRYGSDLAVTLWDTWREARNLVFHYFPHNFRALTRTQADELAKRILLAMNQAVQKTNVRPKKRLSEITMFGTGKHPHFGRGAVPFVS